METTPKRLYRSTQNRVIAGICGGLGEYFNVDPTLIRVGFVILFLGGGIGLLAYLVLWLVIPEHGRSAVIEGTRSPVAAPSGTTPSNPPSPTPVSPNDNRWVIGILLVVVGFMAYGNMFLPWRIFHWNYLWPFLLIVLGIVFLMKRK